MTTESGNTSPKIDQYVIELKAKIPVADHAALESRAQALIDRYRNRYSHAPEYADPRLSRFQGLRRVMILAVTATLYEPTSNRTRSISRGIAYPDLHLDQSLREKCGLEFSVGMFIYSDGGGIARSFHPTSIIFTAT